MAALALLSSMLMTGCATGERPSATRAHPPAPDARSTPSPGPSPDLPPVYPLHATAWWLLNPPKGARFDASGLVLRPDGALWTVSDRGPELYRIDFGASTDEAALAPLAGCYSAGQLARWKVEKHDRYDSEALAGDSQGRIYLAEEADRWILRCDPATGNVERLGIDWSPVAQYFSATDRNASFEGVAVSDDLLFVANERDQGRLVVVDRRTLKVVESFVVRSSRTRGTDIVYSDLCWFDGALYVLMRADQVVLKVDPRSHAVLAEYDYRGVEHGAGMGYFTILSIGLMEGLAVDQESIWLLVDNNGLGRTHNLRDQRPTLFRCPRPDRDGPTRREIQ